MKRVLVIAAGLLTAGAVAGVFAMRSGASPSWTFVGTNVVASGLKGRRSGMIEVVLPSGSAAWSTRVSVRPKNFEMW